MILILRALGLGDLATAVPAIRGLRAAYPGERLALAAPAGLTPLIELIGGVEAVIDTPGLGAALPGGLGAALPGGLSPSIAVNLHGSGPESHRLLQSVAPAKLWAFACAEAGFSDGPPWIAEEHEVARWCRLLRYYGVDADQQELGLATPRAEVPHGVTIIHPGAKSGTRRWPPDRFAAVARALRADGHTVVVTGAAAERPLAVRVAEAAGLSDRDVPATGLDELAALVAHARLVISGDTGISHLATAYRTPSVTLFGPMSPARWGPPDRPYHRTLWKGTRSEPGDRPGPPHPALLAIGEKEVLRAAGEALG
ncbi:glycosyltransferase family 9 protein [Actinoplanes sp. NPDC051411]|uniref:glycosyltransferase family 9 protein n=1 Tax=Actinoplanes sp. NPDC051411 TaxID=3155522 RepID=UPI00342080D2